MQSHKQTIQNPAGHNAKLTCFDQWFLTSNHQVSVLGNCSDIKISLHISDIGFLLGRACPLHQVGMSAPQIRAFGLGLKPSGSTRERQLRQALKYILRCGMSDNRLLCLRNKRTHLTPRVYTVLCVAAGEVRWDVRRTRKMSQ